MGRKIPAKKHRGIKDPLVQQAKRLNSLKGKINAPPIDPDQQPVPRSLIRLFGLEEQYKNKKNVIKRNKPQSHRAQPTDRSRVDSNPVSRLRKTPGESGRDFSLRINSAVRALHNPAEQLHYPGDLDAEDVRGQRMAAQRERRARKRRAAPQTPPPPARQHRLTLRKKEKKMKSVQAQLERPEVEYERVSFGDVAHAPPVLHVKRRAPAPAALPAARRGLLLAPLLACAGSAGGAADAEHARLAAVEAYRALRRTRARTARAHRNT